MPHRRSTSLMDRGTSLYNNCRSASDNLSFDATASQVPTSIENSGQSNLAKGDIVRLTKILSISFIIFARWQHVSRSWSWGYIWDPYFGRRGGRSRVGGHLCIVTTALSPTMCRRMFPTIKSTELGHFGAKFREAGHNNMISSAYRTYFCIPDSKSSKTVYDRCH